MVTGAPGREKGSAPRAADAVVGEGANRFNVARPTQVMYADITCNTKVEPLTIPTVLDQPAHLAGAGGSGHQIAHVGLRTPSIGVCAVRNPHPFVIAQMRTRLRMRRVRAGQRHFPPQSGADCARHR